MDGAKPLFNKRYGHYSEENVEVENRKIWMGWRKLEEIRNKSKERGV